MNNPTLSPEQSDVCSRLVEDYLLNDGHMLQALHRLILKGSSEADLRARFDKHGLDQTAAQVLAANYGIIPAR